ADHKAALDPAELDRRTLGEYALLCGEVLAKGHARTGDAALLAGYAGRSPKLDRAIAAFAVTYAQPVRADYALFCAAHPRRPRTVGARNPGVSQPRDPPRVDAGRAA